MDRIRDQFLDCKNGTLAELETLGDCLAMWHRGLQWWIGDVARYAAARWPDTWQQVFPEWMSPGLIARCRAVAEAYPDESNRNIDATWTQHMRVANQPDRIAQVAAMVEAGQTSDESAKDPPKPARWLLAVDVHYYIHRYYYSGAGVESAMSVAGWIQRTVERLKEKGVTDVVCCFDSPRNARKELTASWEDKYKDRPPKEPELAFQLTLAWQLLSGYGFACCRVDGWEADDCIASAAARFDGRVTILSQDKDLRQCLSGKCNILLDVEWGEEGPEYRWLSAKQHTEETGVRPSQWADYQALCGDSVDAIKGCPGIGEKGATDLIRQFGSAQSAIEAAAAGSDSIPEKKRAALLSFEPKLETTLKLTTLRADLELPTNTRV